MAKAKILLVDDSEISRKPFRVLADPNKINACDLLEAETGEEGLELFKGHDAIGYAIVDVHLPGINGFTMLQQMRDHDPKKFADIRVFMMCSNGPDHDHANEHDHHHEDQSNDLYSTWLLKPVDMDLFERYVLSDSRMRSAMNQENATQMHEDNLRTLFEQTDQLTEKQIQALENIGKSLTQG